MTMRWSVVSPVWWILFAASAGLSVSAAGQSFIYPDFSTLTGLTLNGGAAQSGNVLRVAPAAFSQAGSFYYSSQVPIAGGFDTTFTFQLTGQLGAGADGMVFLIHDDPRGAAALGTLGAWLGYGGGGSSGLTRLLAVELDTWYNAWPQLPDLSNNEISLHVHSNVVGDPDEAFSVGRATALPFLMAGQVHTLRVSYTPGLLSVYLDNLVAPIFTAPYDLQIGGTYLNGLAAPGIAFPAAGAWVGFCASTGGAAQNHDVLSWQWVSTTAPSLAGQGGPAIGTTWTLNLSSPQTPNAPYLLALSLGSQPGIVLPDTRVIPLNPDDLFLFSLQPGNPLFTNFAGFIGPPFATTAWATIAIPNLPILVGATIYAAFVTGDPAQVWGIGGISNALPITFL